MKNLKSFEKFNEKQGLWDNIHDKKKRGEAPANPGDEDYPEADAWKDAQDEESSEAYDINKFSPMAYAKKIVDGSMSFFDAMEDSDLPFSELTKLVKKLDKNFKVTFESKMNEATNSEILDLVDSIHKIIKELKDDPSKDSKKTNKLFNDAKPLVSRLHSLMESKESDLLAKEIDKAMIKIDDSMSYKDFAEAVATILRDEYGQHNYKGFIEELKNNL